MSEPAELPPIADQPLTALLVARDNAADLPEVLDEWLARLEGLGRDYEVLVVDEGSTDETASRVAAVAERQPRVRLLTHPAPRGLGAALRTGLAEARFPLFFYTTCDRQYRPADLKVLLDAIDKVHLVSGYRVWRPVPRPLRWLGLAYRGLLWLLVGEGGPRLPGWLGWSGHFRRFLARWLYGVRFHDVDCAFRLFRRSIFERIPIQSDGDFAQVEILAKANFLGCLMAEEPVGYRPEAAPPAARDRGTWRQTIREARRVLKHPDFGPPHLPGEEKKEEPAAEPAPQPEGSAIGPPPEVGKPPAGENGAGPL